MIKRVTLSHEQARQVVENGDIPDTIKSSTRAVAVILTQSWCPQWTFMKMSLEGLGKGPEDLDLTITTYEYDRSPIFREFMHFKESTYRNWEVPYVRMYRDGKFIGDGNTMPAGRIIEALRRAG